MIDDNLISILLKILFPITVNNVFCSRIYICEGIFKENWSQVIQGDAPVHDFNRDIQ